MFDFLSKKRGVEQELASRVKALETKVASQSLITLTGADVISLQENIIASLQSTVTKQEKAYNRLLRESRKLEKQNTLLAVEKKAPVSREQKIKQAVSKLQPPARKYTNKTLEEITPHKVNINNLNTKDRVAYLSDLLGIEIIKGEGGYSSQNIIKGFMGNNLIRVCYMNSDGYFKITNIHHPCYVLFADPITDKFHLSYIHKDWITEKGNLNVSKDSDKMEIIRRDSAKTLSVLKTKVENK